MNRVSLAPSALPAMPLLTALNATRPQAIHQEGIDGLDARSSLPMAAAAPHGTVPATAEELAALKAHDAEFARAFSSMDAETCAAMYDEHAEFTDLGGLRLTGRDAIRSMFEEDFAGMKQGGQTVRLESVGSTAYRMMDGDPAHPNFIVVGSWKITMIDAQGNASEPAYAASTAVISGSPGQPLKYTFDQVQLLAPGVPPPVGA